MPENRQNLGIQIGEIYCEVMRKLLELVKSRPDKDVIKPSLQELKDTTIDKLVKLGKIREILNENAKNMLNFDIRSQMRNISQTEFKAFTDTVNYYRPIDNALANDIAEFNIITQYADFELLKKQNPRDIDRLGL